MGKIQNLYIFTIIVKYKALRIQEWAGPDALVNKALTS